MADKTTIQISNEFKEFLKTQSVKYGETYEDILKRLIRRRRETKTIEG